MKKKKPGFTLIETIIALALTVTILGITSSMFITGNKVFSDSDAKSTLQIEAQAIQEQLSEIGMQATGIKSFSKNDSENIQIIQINSYYKSENSDNPFYIIYDKGQSKLYKYDAGNSIDTTKISRELLSNNQYKLLSDNVTSIKINDKDISEESESALKNMDSVEFTITLSKNKNYSNKPIIYSIKVKTAFRNKNISNNVS